jgi:hypothetical protein
MFLNGESTVISLRLIFEIILYYVQIAYWFLTLNYLFKQKYKNPDPVLDPYQKSTDPDRGDRKSTYPAETDLDPV